MAAGHDWSIACWRHAGRERRTLPGAPGHRERSTPFHKRLPTLHNLVKQRITWRTLPRLKRQMGNGHSYHTPCGMDFRITCPGRRSQILPPCYLGPDHGIWQPGKGGRKLSWVQLLWPKVNILKMKSDQTWKNANFGTNDRPAWHLVSRKSYYSQKIARGSPIKYPFWSTWCILKCMTPSWSEINR